MGFFSRDNTLPSTWTPIEEEGQIKEIINRSHEKPQIIFKDSTSCGISAGVKHGLVGDWDSLSEKADFNYLDLLSYRGISNLIAQVSKVTHQSPQVIIYHQGEVVADTSHHAIRMQYIEEVLAGL